MLLARRYSIVTRWSPLFCSSHCGHAPQRRYLILFTRFQAPVSSLLWPSLTCPVIISFSSPNFFPSVCGPRPSILITTYFCPLFFTRVFFRAVYFRLSYFICFLGCASRAYAACFDSRCTCSRTTMGRARHCREVRVGRDHVVVLFLCVFVLARRPECDLVWSLRFNPKHLADVPLLRCAIAGRVSGFVQRRFFQVATAVAARALWFRVIGRLRLTLITSLSSFFSIVGWVVPSVWPMLTRSRVYMYATISRSFSSLFCGCLSMTEALVSLAPIFPYEAQQGEWRLGRFWVDCMLFFEISYVSISCFAFSATGSSVWDSLAGMGCIIDMYHFFLLVDTALCRLSLGNKSRLSLSVR